MSTFRVIVDQDVCQGHSVCLSEAPEIFAVEDSGGPYPLARVKIAIVSGDALESARRAARFCPNQSIKIVPYE
jgi:sterol 14-demethylase